MAYDLKSKYPAASSVALTLSLASLASDTNLLVGQASTAVDNYTSTLDLDHALQGVIRLGTSPTAGKSIELWVYAPIDMASGVPTYPDGITGTNAGKTMTSRNVLQYGLRKAHHIIVDGTSNRDFYVPKTSIANLYDGLMPEFWGVFLVHDTAAALNATQVALRYFRHQNQQV